MMEEITAEQKARDLLDRMDIDGAQEMTAGDVLELANLIARRDALEKAMEFISTADSGGEIFPSGPSDTEYSEDGNTVIRHVGPWQFLNGVGGTFLEAVQDAMNKAGEP